MLLSDFITTVLIPTTLMTSTNSEGNVLDGNNQLARTNSRQPLTQSNSGESDILFGDEFFRNIDRVNPEEHVDSWAETRTQVQRSLMNDPILREIYKEEKRLNLNEGDFNMRSEEARDLINFQRNKLQSQLEQILPQDNNVLVVYPEGPDRSIFHGRVGSEESDFNRPPTEIEIPIVIPNLPQVDKDEELVIISTTKAPRKPRFGFFNKVVDGVGSIRRKIFGSSSSSAANQEGIEGSNNPSAEEIIMPTDLASLELNCTDSQTEFNGGCYNVLQSDQCPPGQWLIEDDETGKGKCVENRCADQPNTAYFGGKCVVVRTEGDCHLGMITYIFKNGEVECDCRDKYLFYRRDGNCYPAYRQGPCNAGEVLRTRITDKGAHPAFCERSKCSKDGFFCNSVRCPKDRNCVPLSSPCPNGVFDISPVTLQPACIELDSKLPDKIIGNVPTLQCAPGSRRDILGTCRKPSKITFS